MKIMLRRNGGDSLNNRIITIPELIFSIYDGVLELGHLSVYVSVVHVQKVSMTFRRKTISRTRRFVQNDLPSNTTSGRIYVERQSVEWH